MARRDVLKPPRARRPWWFAAVLFALASGAVLLATADAGEHELARFFGLWRTRHLMVFGVCVLMGVAFVAIAASRRLFFVLLLAVLLFGTTIAVLEVAGFAGLVNYDAAFGRVNPINELGAVQRPHLNVTGHSFQDSAGALGMSTEPIPFSFRTDRRGFRNAIDRTGADIYLVGDSLLVAGLVPVEATLGSRLEQLLDRPVMNVALVGLGVQDERDLMRRERLPLHGRVVLQCVFEGNDLLDSARYRGRAGSVDERPASRWRRALTFHAMLALQRCSDRGYRTRQLRDRTGHIGGQPYSFLWTSRSFRGLDSEIDHVLAALHDVRAHVRESGGRYGIIFLPSKYRVLGELCRWSEESTLAQRDRHVGPLRRALLDWCEAERIPFLDLTGPLTQAARGGRIAWFPLDTHWNSEGHAIAADALAESVMLDELMTAHDE